MNYFFYKSRHPFSNFYPIGGDNAITSEKWFMEYKALHFNDHETLKKISDSKSPMEAKQSGRSVKNYIDEQWAIYRCHYMILALRRKFHQCDEFKDLLIDHKWHNIVEASKYDRIWGIGFYESDAEKNKELWGLNLLGKCLNQLSKEIYL